MPKLKPPAEVVNCGKKLSRGDPRRSARGLAWAETLDEMARSDCQYGQAVKNIEERRLSREN